MDEMIGFTDEMDETGNLAAQLNGEARKVNSKDFR